MKDRRALLETMATFVVALILALFIWANAAQTQDPVRTRFLEVPVAYEGIPQRTVLLEGGQQETVQLRLEGPDSILQELTPNDFRATVDLSQVPPGEVVTVPIVATGGPQGVTISFITPEDVDVQLEEQVTREIPVGLDLRGSVARGHTQGEPLIEPSAVTVSGPAGRVNELDLALVTVFLNNAIETRTEATQPIFYDQQGRVASVTGLDVNTNQITVTVPVEESAGFADKLVNVVWTGEPAPGYRLLSVTADPPSLLVEGRPAQLNVLTSIRTEPIDITGLTESFQQVAVLDLPLSMTVDPDEVVTITVEIEPILTTDTYNRTVEVVGLPPELDAIVRPEQVRVVLFGPLPALDALPEEDVRVSVDVFGLEVGTYTIEPTVDIPDRGIDIRSVQPSAVSVTLTPTITTTAPITSTVTPQSLAPLLPIQVGTGRSAGNLPPTRDFAAVICYLADAGGGVTRYNGPCSRRQIAR
jgi:YbbR domain-containing protein